MRTGISGLLAAIALATAAGCTTTAGGGPGPNYGEIAPSTLASTGGIGACLTDEEAAAVRARALQQQVATATLLCTTGANRERILSDRYNRFMERTQVDWATNAVVLRQVAGARRMDFNAMLTNMANEAATRAATDGTYCARATRALDWALSTPPPPLSRVPPVYDNTGDLRLRPCVPPKATG